MPAFHLESVWWGTLSVLLQLSRVDFACSHRSTQTGTSACKACRSTLRAAGLVAFRIMMCALAKGPLHVTPIIVHRACHYDIPIMGNHSEDCPDQSTRKAVRLW